MSIFYLSQGLRLGEVFTAQFFSSSKLKFILLLKSKDSSAFETIPAISAKDDDEATIPSSISAMQTLQLLSQYFKGKSLFAFMYSDTPSNVPDVLDFFHVSSGDLPCLVAHDPVTDSKYKSSKLNIIQSEASHSLMSSMCWSITTFIDLWLQDSSASHKESSTLNSQVRDFIAGVLSGVIPKVTKSEPVPKINKGHVLQVRIIGYI